MLEEAVSPLGNGSIIKDRGFVHYDKLCLPSKEYFHLIFICQFEQLKINLIANLAKKCPGLIERKLRKTLVGFNMQVITTSYSECIEKCFRESDKCKSAMYYVSVRALYSQSSLIISICLFFTLEYRKLCVKFRG